MSFTATTALNTLWYSHTSSDIPSTSDPDNVVNGAIAVNTAAGKAWIKINNGDVGNGWELLGSGVAGPAGTTPTLNVGSVSTVPVSNGVSQNATVTDGGTALERTFNFGIPVGSTGIQGNPGAAGNDGEVTGSAHATIGLNKIAYWTANGSTAIASSNNASTSANVYGNLIYGAGSIYFGNLTASSGTELVLNGTRVHLDGSSQRYKENIVNLTVDSSNIYNLVPRNFKWRDTQEPVIVDGEVTDTMETITGVNDFGLIAEEVHDVLPELVIYNASNQPETVKYKYLSVLLLAELKKLKDRVTVLEAG